MTAYFSGFSQSGLTFVQDVRIHNSKEWFEEHRHIYTETLLTPFRDLVIDLSQTMLDIDAYFEIRPTIGKTLSRLHRDTRFSHDKSRYRSRMWLTFKRTRKDWQDAPAYFFEISPDSWRYGLGYYCASRATMDLFRQQILKNPSRFLTVAECCQLPFELVGERYKRPLIKEQDPQIARWYNCKSFAVMETNRQVEILFSAKLTDHLRQGFQTLAPLYHYLMQLEALKK